MPLCDPHVSLTAFAVDVSVQFSLKQPIFDLRGLFVMRNVLEGVGFRPQRHFICCTFVHKHGVHQFPLVTATCKDKLCITDPSCMWRKLWCATNLASVISPLTWPIPAVQSLWNCKDSEMKMEKKIKIILTDKDLSFLGKQIKQRH